MLRRGLDCIDSTIYNDDLTHNAARKFTPRIVQDTFFYLQPLHSLSGYRLAGKDSGDDGISLLELNCPLINSSPETFLQVLCPLQPPFLEDLATSR